MERDNLIEKAQAYFSDENLPEKISSIPSLIFEKASLLDDLYRKVGEAKNAAIKAEQMANELKGYEEKKYLWGLIKRKSGKTKEIIEGGQEATKQVAEAQKKNAEAFDLVMQFERQLAATTEFLFYLGCYNIATNEAMIANLTEQLNKEDFERNGKKVKLSTEVKQQFKNVVERLMKQQDVLRHQEQLKIKTKKHEKDIARNINQLNELKSRLNEKEKIDEKQSTLIEEIKESLVQKNQLDAEQSEKIELLIKLLEKKDILDEEQTSQIDEIKKEIANIYSKLKTIMVIGFIVSLLSIIGCVLGWITIND